MSDTPLIYLDGVWSAPPLKGRVYRFAAGEGLPIHAHPTPRHNNHITAVLRGSLTCHGRESIEGKVIKAGDVLDWAIGEPHGFIALENDTVILQVVKEYIEK
jgi:quercetin dioxygenase-like cupin family protein